MIEITLKAYIAVSHDACAYLLSYEGEDADLLGGLSGELTDRGLVIPEGVKEGVYLCSNFHATNLSRDWETGIVDGYDIACEWELKFSLPSIQPKQPAKGVE